MAITLTITDGTTPISFVASTQYVLRGGDDISETDEGVWETFEIAKVDTDANIRALIIRLQKYFALARRWTGDTIENAPITITKGSDGETARIAYLMNGDARVSASGVSSAWLGFGKAVIIVSVLRTEWEDSTANTATSGALSTNGGIYIPSLNDGDMLQRISKLVLTNNTSNTFGKIWLGIRRTRNGTAGFISKWEAELAGSLFSADTTVSADATASGSSRIGITFATTANMADRFSVTVDDVASTLFNDFSGKYLVLGRIKLSSATDEMRVRLSQGVFYSGGVYRFSTVGEVYLSAVDNGNLVYWNLIELGTINLPPADNRNGIHTVGDALKYAGILFSAERISVAGTLYVDEFILIPIDGLLTITEANVSGLLGAEMRVYTDPLGNVISYAAHGATPALVGLPAVVQSWGWPHDGGLIVVACQKNTDHELSLTTTLAFEIYPRWEQYRE